MGFRKLKISEIKGFRLGNATDKQKGTGVTVIVCEKGAVGGIDVRGGAPATIDTDLLKSENTVSEVNAIVLSGGSAFGLEASSGVKRELADRGIGTRFMGMHIPIVCGASLFDLGVGDNKAFPDVKMGIQAVRNAFKGVFKTGNEGAGTGASVGKTLGMDRAMKAGLGTFACGDDYVQAGAVVAVNALGDIYSGAGNIIAGLRSEDGESIYGTVRTLKEKVHSNAASSASPSAAAAPAASSRKKKKTAFSPERSAYNERLARVAQAIKNEFQKTSQFKKEEIDKIISELEKKVEEEVKPEQKYAVPIDELAVKTTAAEKDISAAEKAELFKDKQVTEKKTGLNNIPATEKSPEQKYATPIRRSPAPAGKAKAEAAAPVQKPAQSAQKQSAQAKAVAASQKHVSSERAALPKHGAKPAAPVHGKSSAPAGKAAVPVQKPAPSAQKQVPSGQKPVQSAQRQAPQVRASASQKQAASEKTALPKHGAKHAAPVQRSASAAKPAAPAHEKSSAPAGKAAAPVQKPVSSAQKQVPSGQKPAPSAQRQAPSGQKPAPSAQRQTPSGQNPAQSAKKQAAQVRATAAPQNHVAPEKAVLPKHGAKPAAPVQKPAPSVQKHAAPETAGSDDAQLTINDPAETEAQMAKDAVMDELEAMFSAAEVSIDEPPVSTSSGSGRRSFFDDNDAVKQSGDNMGYDIPFNTTIGCLITNAKLTKSQANKLASILHDAYARAIKPVHSTMDGDTIFVLSSGKQEVNFDAFAALATDVMQYAIIDAVTSASGAYGLPSAEDMKVKE